MKVPIDKANDSINFLKWERCLIGKMKRQFGKSIKRGRGTEHTHVLEKFKKEERDSKQVWHTYYEYILILQNIHIHFIIFNST